MEEEFQSTRVPVPARGYREAGLAQTVRQGRCSRGWNPPEKRLQHLDNDGLPVSSTRSMCAAGTNGGDLETDGGDVKAFGRQCLPGRSRRRSSGIESNGLPRVVRVGEGLVEEGGSVG